MADPHLPQCKNPLKRYWLDTVLGCLTDGRLSVRSCCTGSKSSLDISAGWALGLRITSAGAFVAALVGLPFFLFQTRVPV